MPYFRILIMGLVIAVFSLHTMAQKDACMLYFTFSENAGKAIKDESNNGNDGKIFNDGNTAYGDTYTTGDVIGVYLDLTASKIYFAKNGTIQNSGTGFDITAVGSTDTGVYFPAAGDWGSSYQGTFDFNFGNGLFGNAAQLTGTENTDWFAEDPGQRRIW